MGIETIKKQIAEETEKYDIMIKELDAERANITELIRTFVKGKQRDIIEEEVKRKADYTKELGIEKIREMKKRLDILVEENDNIIDSTFQNDKLWVHVNYVINPAEDEWKQRSNNVKNAEENINLGIKRAIGEAGKILIDFGYEKNPMIDDRTSQWQVNQNNEIVYGKNSTLQLPDTIQKKIKEYAKKIEELHDTLARIGKLGKKLTQQEAVDLWENA